VNKWEDTVRYHRSKLCRASGGRGTSFCIATRKKANRPRLYAVVFRATKRGAVPEAPDIAVDFP
jgi:hypothetical protein